MNYEKHYALLIDRAKRRVLVGQTESHHIVPRCMGGSDAKKNRVLLTPEEHFVAHQLLTKMHPLHPGLAIAAATMATDNRNGKRAGNKLYGWLRRRAAAANSLRRKGVKRSPETCKRISDVLKASAAVLAHKIARTGVARTDDVRRKMSDSHKTSEKAIAARKVLSESKIGVPRTEEARAKMSASHTGKTQTEEHKAKISTAKKGKTFSDEHRANLSKSKTGVRGSRLGAKLSEETKAKMREAALRRYAAT
jgi:hypothetical protein